MRNRLFFFLSCLLLLCCTSGKGAPLNYTIIKNVYQLSTYFEMFDSTSSVGRVIKPHFSLQLTYNLYDNLGDYQGQGVARVFSLGSIYTWARVIDVYDSTGISIGVFQGVMLTTALARFDFFSSSGLLLATAYVDYSVNSVTLVSPTVAEVPYGIIRRQYSVAGPDTWLVQLYDTALLDTRLFAIFSAFIIDNQDAFFS